MSGYHIVVRLNHAEMPSGFLSVSGRQILAKSRRPLCLIGTNAATGSHSSATAEALSLKNCSTTSASSPATLDSTSGKTATREQLTASDMTNSEGTNDDMSSSGSNSSRPGSSEGGSVQSAVEYCPPEYPPLRRAQRLSFAMPIILPDISPSEGRQVISNVAGAVSAPLWFHLCRGTHAHAARAVVVLWHVEFSSAPLFRSQAIVEAGSIEGRLGLIQTGLRKHRKVLAALALLRGLEPT